MGPNMFSGLVNILSTRPRYAENADTRLEIKRHDPEQERRQKEKQEQEEKIGFDTYDNAVVSVESLRVFLQNFLQSVLDKSPASTMPSDTAAPVSPNIPDAPMPHPHAAEASHAASVYKTAAKTARPRMVTPEEAPQSIIDNDEIRMIYKLLNDTAVLRQRGVEFLTIERDDTFLQSLAAAVQKALN